MSFCGGRSIEVSILAVLSEKLVAGDDEAVSDLTEKAIADGLPPKQILDDGLLAGMNTVGEQFKIHEIFLPEVLMAARAMYAGMDKLKPLLLKEGISSRGKVVLGSVKGDLHDIGKNLVGIMLKGAGFEVIDLGYDVPPEKFVQTARDEDARVIGMSALLTTTMPAMKAVIELVKQQGLTGQLKTIVGGAPVSAAFAAEIGADAHGYDAANAVERVKALLSEN
jgi:5-methyltetrahydrofolate--homocysteine methyltransferase